MKPQNDLEIAQYVTDVVQHSGKLNRLMSEGQLYKVIEVLSEIERSAGFAQRRIGEKVGISA